MENKIGDAINSEGFLFQKYCVEKIKLAGWTIDSEEYPISENESFDIKVSNAVDVARALAVVECKRQDPQRKRWIFFKSEALSPKSNPFSVMVHCLYILEGMSRKAEVMRGVMEGVNEKILESPLCHTTAVEVYKDPKKRDSWQTNTEVIYKASLKVAKGVDYLFHSEAENIQFLIKYGLKRLEKERTTLGYQYYTNEEIIPVIITSAPLLSVSFKPEQMNTDTFKVAFENLDTEQCKWLVYEFPLPIELRRESKFFRRISEDNRYAKMHIFMVNANWIKDFFIALIESIQKNGGEQGRVVSPQFSDIYKPIK